MTLILLALRRSPRRIRPSSGLGRTLVKGKLAPVKSQSCPLKFARARAKLPRSGAAGRVSTLKRSEGTEPQLSYNVLSFPARHNILRSIVDRTQDAVLYSHTKSPVSRLYPLPIRVPPRHLDMRLTFNSGVKPAWPSGTRRTVTMRRSSSRARYEHILYTSPTLPSRGISIDNICLSLSQNRSTAW